MNSQWHVQSSCLQALTGFCTHWVNLKMSILLPLCYSNKVFYYLDNWLVIHPNLQLYFFSHCFFSVMAIAIWFQLLADNFKHTLISVFSVKMLCVKVCCLKQDIYRKLNWKVHREPMILKALKWLMLLPCLPLVFMLNEIFLHRFWLWIQLWFLFNRDPFTDVDDCSSEE